ncbi:unnamed protein product [Cyprideis torosa]|uniref:Uncharacterized protein n=1 Tax=Cyprideis torosa TaxID=163714 RepID=A0A7R8ZSK2_9CRUS|nr:unnamed protein product [Cyprideis torosa]CAG0895711.1 unnamed protein product [Cyprideis torosa]
MVQAASSRVQAPEEFLQVPWDERDATIQNSGHPEESWIPETGGFERNQGFWGGESYPPLSGQTQHEAESAKHPLVPHGEPQRGYQYSNDQEKPPEEKLGEIPGFEPNRVYDPYHQTPPSYLELPTWKEPDRGKEEFSGYNEIREDRKFNQFLSRDDAKDGDPLQWIIDNFLELSLGIAVGAGALISISLALTSFCFAGTSVFMFKSVFADLLNRIPLRVQRRKGHTRETSKTERGVE